MTFDPVSVRQQDGPEAVRVVVDRRPQNARLKARPEGTMRMPVFCTTALAYVVIGHPPPAVAQVDQQRAQEFFKEAQSLCERDGGRLWGMSIGTIQAFFSQQLQMGCRVWLREPRFVKRAIAKRRRAKPRGPAARSRRAQSAACVCQPRNRSRRSRFDSSASPAAFRPRVQVTERTLR